MTTATAQNVQPDVDHALMVELGVVIQSLMFRQRVTQKQLADALGITPGSVSRKLRGDVAISVPEMCKIARALGVNPGDLLPVLPQLDSNQQPFGYTSPLVSATVAHYGDAAAAFLSGDTLRALHWLGGTDIAWFEQHEQGRGFDAAVRDALREVTA